MTHDRAKLVVSEALRSIGANLSTSFAATMTVLIGMFLLGLLIALGTWVVSWSDHVKDQLEVKVFFVDDVEADSRSTPSARTSAVETDAERSRTTSSSRARRRSSACRSATPS